MEKKDGESKGMRMRQEVNYGDIYILYADYKYCF